MNNAQRRKLLRGTRLSAAAACAKRSCGSVWGTDLGGALLLSERNSIVLLSGCVAERSICSILGMRHSLRAGFGEPPVAHVFFHLAQTNGHRVQRGGLDALGYHAMQFGPEMLDLAQNRRSRGRQSQAPDASVLGIDAALDEAK